MPSSAVSLALGDTSPGEVGCAAGLAAPGTAGHSPAREACPSRDETLPVCADPPLGTRSGEHSQRPRFLPGSSVATEHPRLGRSIGVAGPLVVSRDLGVRGGSPFWPTPHPFGPNQPSVRSSDRSDAWGSPRKFSTRSINSGGDGLDLGLPIKTTAFCPEQANAQSLRSGFVSEHSTIEAFGANYVRLCWFVL